MLWSLSASKWGQLSSNHLMSMSTSTPTMHALCFWEQPSYVNVNIHSYSACSMFLRTIILCQCQHPLLQHILGLRLWKQPSYVNVNIHSYSACPMFLRTIILCQCQHPLLQCILYVFENNHLMSVSTSAPTVHTLITFLRTTISCQCQHPFIHSMFLRTVILCQCQHLLQQCIVYVFENNHLMSMSTSTHTLCVPENKLAAQSILECLK